MPTQKQKQEPKDSRSAPNSAAGEWAEGALTVTSRASTSFSSSPVRIRRTASATASS